MWSLLFLACGGPSASELSARALAEGDAAQCAAIDIEGMRTDCHLLLSAELARAGLVDEAVAVCGGVSAGKWHDECVFGVADEAELLEGAAMDVCAQAGDFEYRCLTHAARRHAMRDVYATCAAGSEQACFEHSLPVMERYLGGPAARGYATNLVVFWQAGQDEGKPFNTASCGSLDAETCARVYAHRTRNGGPPAGEDAPWKDACGEPLTAELAAASDFPEWSSEMDPIVQAAWELLCRSPRLQASRAEAGGPGQGGPGQGGPGMGGPGMGGPGMGGPGKGPGDLRAAGGTGSQGGPSGPRGPSEPQDSP